MRGKEDLLDEQVAAMAELEKSSASVLFGVFDLGNDAEAGNVAKEGSERLPRPESRCA